MGRKRATHCKAGHALEGGNLLGHKRGDKVVTECRECAAKRKRDKRAEKSPKRRFVQNVQNVDLVMDCQKIGTAQIGGSRMAGANIIGTIEDGQGDVVEISAIVNDESLAKQIGDHRGLYQLEDSAGNVGVAAVAASPTESHGASPEPGIFEEGLDGIATFPSPGDFGFGGIQRTEASVQPQLTQNQPQLTMTRPPRPAPPKCPHGFSLAAMCPQCRAAS